MSKPKAASRWAITAMSSQVAPTLQVTRSGKGKWALLTKAPNIARTGQNESSMPNWSANSSIPVRFSMRHGSHQAPSA